MVEALKNKNNTSVVYIMIALILIFGGVNEILLAIEYLNHKKTEHHKKDGCIDITNKDEYSTMEKINAKKAADKSDRENIVTEKENHMDDDITSNIVFGSIILFLSVFLIAVGIVPHFGSDFFDNLYHKTGYNILLIVIGLICVSASITKGILIDKYRKDKYYTKRIVATCVKLDDLNTEEDIKKAFERRESLPESEPTLIIKLNIATAVIFGTIGGILCLMGITSFIKKSENIKQPIVAQQPIAPQPIAPQPIAPQPIAPVQGMNPGNITINISAESLKSSNPSAGVNVDPTRSKAIYLAE